MFQLRSAVARGRRDEFVSAVLSWCAPEGGDRVSEVIVLGSTAAEERLDGQIKGTQLRYVSTRQDLEVFR